MTDAMSPTLAGSEWTTAEISAVVSDYLAMFAKEVAGTAYNKREHNRGLQAITGRSPGSIEFKHQNISAVLAELGLPWLRGYKPRSNFQDALIAEVDRQIKRLDWLDEAPLPLPVLSNAERRIFVEPPTRSPALEQPALGRLVQKFDPAERDRRNSELGKAGEEFVVRVEERALLMGGRPDLMRKVRWVSRDDGDGAGFDIRSFDLETGRERLIEVKTTRGSARTPFYVTRNEETTSRELGDAWRLYRVFEFGPAPKIFTVVPPLDQQVRLTPTTWLASI